MNMPADDFRKSIRGKDVAVVGIGLSNIPLIRFLAGCGAAVTARDKKPRGKLAAADELEELGVRLKLGDDYLGGLNAEMIFKTPGMRFDIPEFKAARRNGSIITSEMELFLRLCPARTIGVTGSDGKTTTTTLIYKMLKQEGLGAWIGGNIGAPLIGEIDNIKPSDYAVLELSSFQLHTMRLSPDTAVITNITPNHLDMHKSYDEYICAKENIMRYQNETSRLIVNYDNEVTRKIGEKARGKCIGFSYAGNADIYFHDGWICAEDEKIISAADIKIPGRYNIENYMAAIGAVRDVVSCESVSSVAKSFGGAEHRNEYVRTVGGVSFYNSSIDSSPNRTKNTLSVFDDKVILIAGGKDKGIEYDMLGESLAEKVKVLILTGLTADKIESALKNEIKRSGRGADVEIVRAGSYEEAVRVAYEKASSGDTVLLSPASTSFDCFDNFEQRGRLFKKLVMGLGKD